MFLMVSGLAGTLIVVLQVLEKWCSWNGDVCGNGDFGQIVGREMVKLKSEETSGGPRNKRNPLIAPACDTS